MNMKGPSIAENIKKLRLKLNLTQEKFAQKIGVSFSTVNEWERGKRLPSPLAMRQIEELWRQVKRKRK